ncbi:Sodium-coupled monocarboxylate transporter 2 [Araneus ventricosus]|uniref:Sodium-coupled monocarboxylate transporter 2 n=1 Tax=Araneus ventricosus TaxID=182803 RepID=A0A4Y2VEU2_ARAVE|nr:Sodium-coupled monocarboxylate transporter 2 [Araneus ventricosus]
MQGDHLAFCCAACRILMAQTCNLTKGESLNCDWRALQWSILLVVTLLFSCTFFGIILYAVYFHCDPILMQSETGIRKYDQLVPYFIVTRLHSIPGLTGLCFAGIFSGSLSTISSALNSLSTVTLIDFVQPLFSDRLNPTLELYIAKGLSLMYGVATIALTLAITNVDSLAQATIVFMSVAEGPVLAVFLVGVLTRKASDKVISFLDVFLTNSFLYVKSFK